MTPLRKRRHSYTTYRALGGTLSLQDWLASERQKAQAADAIVLPPSFWWAVVVCGLTVGGIIVGVANAAGWLG